MFGDPVGGPHPPLLSPGTGIHPLFGPRTLAVAPPHEGYQPIPQAGDADDCSRGGAAAGRRASRPESGGGGMWRGGHGSAAGERLRRQR